MGDSQDLARALLGRALAAKDVDRPDLRAWIERVVPAQAPVPWHLQQLVALFQRAMRERVFALVSMPPRHAKSTTVRRALAYAILRYPDRLNAFVTYASGYARTHSRAIRKLVVQQGGRIAEDAANVDNWRTPDEGGLSVTGRDGQLTGKGFTGLLVLDDLIKNRKEAESVHLREQLAESFSDDIYTRSEPPFGSIIVIATRWHEYFAELYCAREDLKYADASLRLHAERDWEGFQKAYPRPSPEQLLASASHGARTTPIVPPSGAAPGGAVGPAGTGPSPASAVVSLVRAHMGMARAQGRDLSFSAALAEVSG